MIDQKFIDPALFLLMPKAISNYLNKKDEDRDTIYKCCKWLVQRSPGDNNFVNSDCQEMKTVITAFGETSAKPDEIEIHVSFLLQYSLMFRHEYYLQMDHPIDVETRTAQIDVMARTLIDMLKAANLTQEANHFQQLIDRYQAIFNDKTPVLTTDNLIKELVNKVPSANERRHLLYRNDREFKEAKLSETTEETICTLREGFIADPSIPMSVTYRLLTSAYQVGQGEIASYAVTNKIIEKISTKLLSYTAKEGEYLSFKRVTKHMLDEMQRAMKIHMGDILVDGNKNPEIQIKRAKEIFQMFNIAVWDCVHKNSEYFLDASDLSSPIYYAFYIYEVLLESYANAYRDRLAEQKSSDNTFLRYVKLYIELLLTALTQTNAVNEWPTCSKTVEACKAKWTDINTSTEKDRTIREYITERTHKVRSALFEYTSRLNCNSKLVAKLIGDNEQFKRFTYSISTQQKSFFVKYIASVIDSALKVEQLENTIQRLITAAVLSTRITIGEVLLEKCLVSNGATTQQYSSAITALFVLFGPEFLYKDFEIFSRNKHLLVSTLQKIHSPRLITCLSRAARTGKIDLKNLFAEIKDNAGVNKVLEIYNSQETPKKINQKVVKSGMAKHKAAQKTIRPGTENSDYAVDNIEKGLIDLFSMNVHEAFEESLTLAYDYAECLIFNRIVQGAKLDVEEIVAIKDAMINTIIRETHTDIIEKIDFMIIVFCHNIQTTIKPNEDESYPEYRVRIFNEMLCALTNTDDGFANAETLPAFFYDTLKQQTCAYFLMFPNQELYPTYIVKEIVSNAIDGELLFDSSQHEILANIEMQLQQFDQLLRLKQAEKAAYSVEDINFLVSVSNSEHLNAHELYIQTVLQLVKSTHKFEWGSDILQKYKLELKPIVQLSAFALLKCSYSDIQTCERILMTQIQTVLQAIIEQTDSNLLTRVMIGQSDWLVYSFQQLHALNEQTLGKASMTAFNSFIEKCHDLLNLLVAAAKNREGDIYNAQQITSFINWLSGLLGNYAEYIRATRMEFKNANYAQYLETYNQDRFKVEDDDELDAVIKETADEAYRNLLHVIVEAVSKCETAPYPKPQQLLITVAGKTPTSFLQLYEQILSTPQNTNTLHEHFYVAATQTITAEAMLNMLLFTKRLSEKSLTALERFCKDVQTGNIRFTSQALPKPSFDLYASLLKAQSDNKTHITSIICKLFANVHTEVDYQSLHRILQEHYGIASASERETILTAHIAQLDDKDKRLDYNLSQMTTTSTNPESDSTTHRFDAHINSTNSAKVPIHWREKLDPAQTENVMTLTFTSDEFLQKLKVQTHRLTTINVHTITDIFFSSDIYKCSEEYAPLRLIEGVMQLESDTAEQFDGIEKRIEDIKNGLLPNLQLYICLKNLDRTLYQFECKETKQRNIERFNTRVKDLWKKIDTFIGVCSSYIPMYLKLAHKYSSLRIKRTKLSSIEDTEQCDYENLKQEYTAFLKDIDTVLDELQKWPNLMERFTIELGGINDLLSSFNKDKLKVDADISMSKEGRLYLMMTATIEANLNIPHTSLQDRLKESIIQSQIELLNQTEHKNRQARRELIQTPPKPVRSTPSPDPVLPTPEPTKAETKKDGAKTPPRTPNASPKQKSPVTPTRTSPTKRTTPLSKDELNAFKTSIAEPLKNQFLTRLEDIEASYRSIQFNDSQPITSLFLLLESLIRLLNLSTHPLNLSAGDDQKFVRHLKKYNFNLDMVAPNKDEVNVTELKTLRAIIMHAHYSVFTLPNFSTHVMISALYSQLSQYTRALLDHLQKKANAPTINQRLGESMRTQLSRPDTVRKDNESLSLETKQNTLSLLKALYKTMKLEWRKIDTPFADQAIASITLLSIVTRVFVTPTKQQQRAPKISSQTRVFFMRKGHGFNSLLPDRNRTNATEATTEIASLLEGHKDSTSPVPGSVIN